VKVSICMASYNHGAQLAVTLESIRRQKSAHDVEIIVCDDGSEDDTEAVCERFGVTRTYLDRPFYANPSAARNAAYRLASGDVVIAQSDETIHVTDDAIDRLVMLSPGTFNIATVYALNQHGSRVSEYTGVTNRRPFFFLGSLRMSDLRAVGGDDEDFDLPGCDDDWLGYRLTEGLGLRPEWRQDVIGHHQWHWRPDSKDAVPAFRKMRDLLAAKLAVARDTGNWRPGKGAWEES
jgi:glycosyltransferase involved in cell wall biosynthesis